MNASTTIVGPGIHSETRSVENPSTPITWAQLESILVGSSAPGLRAVSATASQKIGAVFACTRILATSIARMPLPVYRATENGRERAYDHPMYLPLTMRANRDMSAVSARTAIAANLFLRGRGYAEILRGRGGQAIGYIPIESQRVTPFDDEGELWYRVLMPKGGTVNIHQDDMIDVPYVPLDGFTGQSVIANAQVSLGGARTSDEYSARWAANNIRPGGALTHPKALSEPAAQKLRQSIQQMHGGADNAGKFMILEEGMTYAPFSMPLVEAQWIEMSEFRVEDIARWFGVPPHLIGQTDAAAARTIEQLGLDFLTFGLGPTLEAMEQEFNWKLFSLAERGRVYCEHLRQSLIAMDAATRGAWYERGLRSGWFSPDDVRELENMNRLPEERGTVTTIPANQMPAPTPAQADALHAKWAGAKGPGDPKESGQPQPDADGKLAGDNGRG